MQLFEELGRVIEAEWRGADYDESRFPAIAAEALRAANMPSQLSAWDVIKWALAADVLPPQKDLPGHFGDPPVTLFVGSRFYIDVYFWLDGTTSIHQHSFCGAFQVLMGSSIHSWYDFEAREAVNAYMQIGDMTLKQCDLLSVGDVQEIRSGREYIHALFHLDQPSATIVVRTDKSPLSLPQFSYHKPSLALDPFYENETSIKKLQCIRPLYQIEHPDADNVVKDLLSNSDLQTSFEILTMMRELLKHDPVGQMFGLSGREGRFDTFLDVVRERHGDERAEVALEVIKYRESIAEIVNRRRVVTDAEHRFFLAVVMNVTGREKIFALVKKRFPDAEPAEKILDWVYDLGNTRIAGDQNANALGIEGFGDADLYALEKLMSGSDPSEVISAFEADYGAERAAAADIRGRIGRIIESPIFQPLMLA